jgi:hypothetical protein
VDIPEALATPQELSAKDIHATRIDRRNQVIILMDKNSRNIVVDQTSTPLSLPNLEDSDLQKI